jgi:hypothetical protein
LIALIRVLRLPDSSHLLRMEPLQKLQLLSNSPFAIPFACVRMLEGEIDRHGGIQERSLRFSGECCVGLNPVQSSNLPSLPNHQVTPTASSQSYPSPPRRDKPSITLIPSHRNPKNDIRNSARAIRQARAGDLAPMRAPQKWW